MWSLRTPPVASVHFLQAPEDTKDEAIPDSVKAEFARAIVLETAKVRCGVTAPPALWSPTSAWCPRDVLSARADLQRLPAFGRR